MFVQLVASFRVEKYVVFACLDDGGDYIAVETSCIVIRSGLVAHCAMEQVYLGMCAMNGWMYLSVRSCQFG